MRLSGFDADQLPPVALSSDVIAPATATTTEALTQTMCANTTSTTSKRHANVV